MSLLVDASQITLGTFSLNISIKSIFNRLKFKMRVRSVTIIPDATRLQPAFDNTKLRSLLSVLAS